MKIAMNPKIAAIFAVFCFSMTSIIIKVLNASAIMIIFYREFFSVIIAFILYLVSHSYKDNKASLRAYIYSILAGVIFAVYIVSWVFSVRNTTIACATVISDIHPVFVVAIMFFIFKEKFKGISLIGIVIAIIGCVIIFASDLLGFGNGFIGNLFALLTALSTGLFLILGSVVRKEMSAIQYLLFYNISCFITVGIVALMTKTPLTGYPFSEYFFIFLLAFVVTIMGHGVMGWSLKYLKPSFVSLVFLLEPVFAGVIAFLLFSELPTVLQTIGCIVIMSGIYLYNKHEET